MEFTSNESLGNIDHSQGTDNILLFGIFTYDLLVQNVNFRSLPTRLYDYYTGLYDYQAALKNLLSLGLL